MEYTVKDQEFNSLEEIVSSIKVQMRDLAGESSFKLVFENCKLLNKIEINSEANLIFKVVTELTFRKCELNHVKINNLDKVSEIAFIGCDISASEISNISMTGTMTFNRCYIRGTELLRLKLDSLIFIECHIAQYQYHESAIKDIKIAHSLYFQSTNMGNLAVWYVMTKNVFLYDCVIGGEVKFSAGSLKNMDVYMISHTSILQQPFTEPVIMVGPISILNHFIYYFPKSDIVDHNLEDNPIKMDLVTFMKTVRRLYGNKENLNKRITVDGMATTNKKILAEFEAVNKMLTAMKGK